MLQIYLHNDDVREEKKGLSSLKYEEVEQKVEIFQLRNYLLSQFFQLPEGI